LAYDFDKTLGDEWAGSAAGDGGAEGKTQPQTIGASMFAVGSGTGF
jgi:hypothetical protein